MKRIVGLGAGGHAEILIEILRSTGQWEIVGLMDEDAQKHGLSVAEVPILGDDSQLQKLTADGVVHAFLGVGGFGSAAPRQRIAARAASFGFSFPQIAHATAWISPSAAVGEGCHLLAGAIVNTSVVLGRHVIVNTGVTVDHHCRVGDFAHLAPGSVLTGRVEAGEGVQIGAGAVVRDGVRIGRGAVVGAGAVVLSEIGPNRVAVGTPAREIHDVC